MLEFVLCEDDREFRQEIKKEIEDFMMKSDVEYKIKQFKGYGKEFEDYVKEEKKSHIYFLDIKTECGSGLDAARYIREEREDWTSIIVMITAFSEYRYEAVTNRLYLLDFINKLDHCKKKIKEDLEIILKQYTDKEKCLVYEYKYVVEKIEYRYILYIEKEIGSKYSIIHSENGNKKIQKTIKELEEELDERFLKIHRSIIVNTDKIKKYDRKKNEILLENGEKIDMISREKKKELIEIVTGIS